MAFPLARADSVTSLSSLNDFKEASQEDAAHALRHELGRLLPIIPEPHKTEAAANFEGFANLFEQYIKESGSKIDWSRIRPPTEGMIRPLDSLPKPAPDHEKALLSKLAILKLNGGLGTSMGCVGPKSAISVRQDLTFLDLCVRQIEYLNTKHDVNVPLVLMNSFNTHKDTLKILRKYRQNRIEVLTFNQSRYPRILKDTLLPLPTDNNDDSQWYPPGHGDLYRSIYTTGCLDQLIAEGKEWLFIANIDNLGATVDMNILNYLVNENKECEFVMEVTDKTRADIKGGTLIEYEGGIRLLEVAQVPKEHLESFKSVTKFRVFNTNNIWIKLSAIKRLVEADSIHMEVIENKKDLDDGRSIIQLEQAVGAGIKNFAGAIGINVPRSRFLPVKKTSDLLLAMSNLYQLQHGCLVMNASRLFQNVPLIKLGDHHFAKVAQFLKRFENIPDIVELDHLTVSGNVYFGKNVSLRGTVIIIANEDEQIDIPAGAILENKIVTGNLRIMDH